MVNVSIAISDFNEALTRLDPPAPVAAPIPVPVVPSVVKAVAPKPVKKCVASAPEGFTIIKSVEYGCDDTAAKSSAEKSIADAVSKERSRRSKVAAERERKQRAAAAAKKKELAAVEKAMAAEQAAIAASAAKTQALSSEIAQKMLGVCQKKWAAGEHRCYCEKYIEHAPAGIASDPSCK